MPGPTSPEMLPGCADRMAQSNPGPEGIVDNGGWPQTPCDSCGVGQGEPCKRAEQAAVPGRADSDQAVPAPDGIVETRTPRFVFILELEQPSPYSDQAVPAPDAPAKSRSAEPAGQPSPYSDQEALRQAQARIAQLEAELEYERVLTKQLRASLAAVAVATMGGAAGAEVRQLVLEVAR